jgi:hypothetical protein
MDALKKDSSSNIEKQTKEMKVMQHELNQSIKSLGIKLDRVETRLEQDIKDVREDVQADLRNLKNEIIPDLKAVRLFSSIPWTCLILVIIATESGPWWACTSRKSPLSRWEGPHHRGEFHLHKPWCSSLN